MANSPNSTTNRLPRHLPDPPQQDEQEARRANALEILRNSGLGRSSPQDTTSSSLRSINEALSKYEKQFFPGQPKSLSGIAIRSFILGISLCFLLTSTFYIILTTTSPLWRLPFFLSLLSLFHFLEFWTTANYNTRSAQISSFLFSQNGAAWNIAHLSALLECLLLNIFVFPHGNILPAYLSHTILFTGLFLITISQVTRSLAMAEAGTNFNHIVQYTKAQSHQLVETGVYSILRHPSYFGFFWWGIGTQLMLGNPICTVGYVLVLWRFFRKRIEGEEHYLVKFFGERYESFRGRTWVGIPLIG